MAGLPDLAQKRAVDLGCGTGKLTGELHRRLHLAETVGIDSSSAMLAEAASVKAPGLRFELGTVEAFAPTRPVDLIFSNAALQWCDDHAKLLARLKTHLTPGGWLAIQVPANHSHLSHKVAAEVAGESPFREALGGYHRVSPVLAPDAYVQILARLGFENPIVQTRAYLHQLPSREAIVEWVKGTLLTAYQKRLSSHLWPQFLKRYSEKLMPQLLDEKPYLYPFLRTFLWASA